MLGDLSLREYFHALKVHTDVRIAEFRERYEVARFQAVLIINFSPRLKKHIDDPRKLVPFAWEEGIVVKKQSMEEMKLAIQSVVGPNVVRKTGKKHPDAPPTYLARKNKK